MNEILSFVDEANDQLYYKYPQIQPSRMAYKEYIRRQLEYSTAVPELDASRLSREARKWKDRFADVEFKDIYEYANFLADIMTQQ